MLPVHNQADHIEDVVERYEAALQPVPASRQIVLVENGSRDGSWDACRRLAQRFECVDAIEEPKGSWGHAVKIGLARAQGDLLCYTNSARTSPQDLVLCLVYAMANPGVVVKANRKIRDSWGRRLGSLIYNLECRALFDLSYWDINGTPKVFPRTFDKLCALQREDDLIDLEFNVICRREAYPLLEVPILSTTRHGGRSTTRLGSALKLYAGAHAMWRSQI